MRYRRDIPRGDRQLIAETVDHVIDHLRGAADPHDDPTQIERDRVNIEILDHVDGDPNLISVIGELDAAPVVHYLSPDFDPSTDYPEIKFKPYTEPARGHYADAKAFDQWRDENPR